MAVRSQDSGGPSTEQQLSSIAAWKLHALHPCSACKGQAVQRRRQS